MRINIILQFATLLVLLLVTSVKGLFFQYPKNALIDFFQSLHQKKEMKKSPQNIHHYHLHYYPVYTQHYMTKPLKAPIKFELDKLHSNHLETLGWNDHEYTHVPDPDIYKTSPLHDSWSETSDSRPSIWDEEIPNYRLETFEQPDASKAGIIVQVPIHQNIVVQPIKEEKPATNPLISFFKGINRIKNSLFSHQKGNDHTDLENDESSIIGGMKSYVLYFKPEYGRKL